MVQSSRLGAGCCLCELGAGFSSGAEPHGAVNGAVQGLIRRFREEVRGGRILSATTGSAPSAPDILRWLEEVLGFPIINAYGSTEGGMITMDSKMTQ